MNCIKLVAMKVENTECCENFKWEFDETYFSTLYNMYSRTRNNIEEHIDTVFLIVDMLVFLVTIPPFRTKVSKYY